MDMLLALPKGNRGEVVLVTNAKSEYDDSDEDERSLVAGVEKALAEKSNKLTLTVLWVPSQMSASRPSAPPHYTRS
jgi:hypothetical protein